MTTRGTTLRIRRDPDPSRQKPWGLHWNVYQEGFTGRPKAKSKWFATEAEAETFKATVLEELAKGAVLPGADDEPVYRRADSLAARLPAWLKHVGEQNDEATHYSYSSCVKNYLAPRPGHPRYPGLGDLIVNDTHLTSKAAADYMLALYQAGISLSMRRRLKTTLSAFCTYAKFAGWLKGDNPCYALGRILRQKGEADQDPAPNPFSVEELERLFDHITAVEPAWLPYFTFLLHVGVRVGEAAALKWSAVQLESRPRPTASIELNYSARKKDHDGNKLPKTHKRRTVELSAALVTILLKWKVTQAEAAFRRFGQRAPVYVFTTKRGCRALPGGNVRLVFKRIMEACKITGHTLHDFRDSFATSHLLANWDKKLPWVSKQLGHATPLTTARHYYAYRSTAGDDSYADDQVFGK